MSSYFVPYSGKRPAATLINGHRLLILSVEANSLREHLKELGADRVKKIKGGSSKKEDEVILSKLAIEAEAGIVLAPGEIEVQEVIKNLESQLPWIQ